MKVGYAGILRREELDYAFLFPVWSYVDLASDEFVYVSDRKEIGRLAIERDLDYVQFLDLEIELLTSLRATDYEI